MVVILSQGESPQDKASPFRERRTSGCMSFSGFQPLLQGRAGAPALGNKRDTFLCFNHLHNFGIITLAASCGKQKPTSTNYSTSPQWVALNRMLASGTRIIIRLSNNGQGKLRENELSVNNKTKEAGEWITAVEGRVSPLLGECCIASSL